MDIFPSEAERLHPYPFYASMRHNTPVAYDDNKDAWGIYRYNDVLQVISNYNIFSSDPKVWNNYTRPSRPLGNMMVTDPPLHTHLRKLVSEWFSASSVNKIQFKVHNIASKLIDRIVQLSDIDIVEEIAYPFPLMVMSEFMGLPESDHKLFIEWTRKFLGITRNNLSVKEVRRTDLQLKKEMHSYFEDVVSVKSHNGDLIFDLVRSKTEGKILLEEELYGFLSFLLLSGAVTSVNMIGNTILSLCEFPYEYEKLKDDPSLIPKSIEESLRYRSPAQLVTRYCSNDTIVRGQKITKGQMVVLWIGSANHDESIFINPEQFDTMNDSRPHLAFGSGTHSCLGSSLARLMGTVLLEVLTHRIQAIKIVENRKPKVLDSSLFYGIAHLPVVIACR